MSGNQSNAPCPACDGYVDDLAEIRRCLGADGGGGRPSDREGDRLRQDRLVWRAADHVAADAERAEGVAVVALAAGDETVALRLADLQHVLAGELQRRLGRLRAGGDEVGAGEAGRLVADENLGERLGRLVGVEAGVGVGEAVQLIAQRGQHARMAVPDGRDGGAAGPVDHGVAARVGQADAATVAGDGRRGFQVAV